MVGHTSRFMTRFVSRWFPDPLISTMLLTLLTFVIAFWLTSQMPISMVRTWGDDFWNLLALGMQMTLIIVAGHVLASSIPVENLLHTAASAAKTPAQGAVLVIFFGLVACVINWGLGSAVGAMFAREVARRVPGSDYPLLTACAYIGLLTQGGGLSGSIPPLAATSGNPAEHIARLIPAGDTLFSDSNIFVTVTLIVVIPFTIRMMMPKPFDVVGIDPKLFMEEADFQKQLPKDAPPSERLEESRTLALIISAPGIAYPAMYFSEHGFNITTNIVNLMLMTAGLLLRKTPMAHMRAISTAARSTAGILVQFPFYAGIQLMTGHSGLGGLIAELFINVTNEDTLSVTTFFSSALINSTVPSGGGHWVIQGPFVIPAAQVLGADLGRSVMAIAYGEQWTNMAQPFWVLPVLAIAGLGVRDIVNYCITVLSFSGVIFVIGLTLS